MREDMRRETKKRGYGELLLFVAAILVISIAMSIAVVMDGNKEDAPEPTEGHVIGLTTAVKETQIAKEMPMSTAKAVEEEDTAYYDVPLSEEYQDYVIATCRAYNIAPALVFAIMERESGFDAAKVGDDGKSIGIMQIYAAYHKERMERLGVTDLYDPYQNALVGIDYLAGAFARDEDLYWVLMMYNGGEAYADQHMNAADYSNYAVEISERAAELERK
jgi:soluble lytic murein transglycosylase-like protein